MTVRVRMAPSPTGHPHVGLVRTALFNWAFARRNGGTFVLRIEDTDTARNSEDSYRDILDLFHWLGLEWDEGPDVGGAYGPYRQSERTDLYRDALAKLSAGGFTYPCYCSPEEVKERAGARGDKARGYDGFCRKLSLTDRTGLMARGRRPVTRLRVPEGDIAFEDAVRGSVSFHSSNVPDPVLAKADGSPLYTLVNPVDDALMAITHVFRGEDMLPSTPRQIPLYHALAAVGIGTGPPKFGHLPYVMGKGNAKLSKRDPEANALMYREAGFLPEGLLNYLALLGWSLSGDRDVFSMTDFVDAFAIEDVLPNPGRFDLKKADAINAAHMHQLDPASMLSHAMPDLVKRGFVDDPLTRHQARMLEGAMPLVAPRVNKLTEIGPMVEFLLVSESDFTVNLEEATKAFTEDGRETLRLALTALKSVTPWTAEALKVALTRTLVEEAGLKPRHAFGAVRLATSGKRISPPLFESLELLGRARTLSRIEAALALRLA